MSRHCKGRAPAQRYLRSPPCGAQVGKDHVFRRLCAAFLNLVLCGWHSSFFVKSNAHLLSVRIDDDGGGFYDHVVPPMEGVPNPESPCQIMDGCHKPFDFKRLGIRVTSMIMSPWIPANLAVKKPTKPKPTSQYDLTSGIATAKVLFDLDTFLTKRDAWAGTFDQRESELLFASTSPNAFVLCGSSFSVASSNVRTALVLQ